MALIAEEEIDPLLLAAVNSQSIRALITLSQKSVNSRLKKVPETSVEGVPRPLCETERELNNSLEWGRNLFMTSADGHVLHFLWRNGAIVSFLSTVGTPSKEVIRSRRDTIAWENTY